MRFIKRLIFKTMASKWCKLRLHRFPANRKNYAGSLQYGTAVCAESLFLIILVLLYAIFGPCFSRSRPLEDLCFWLRSSHHDEENVWIDERVVPCSWSSLYTSTFWIKNRLSLSESADEVGRWKQHICICHHRVPSFSSCCLFHFSFYSNHQHLHHHTHTHSHSLTIDILLNHRLEVVEWATDWGDLPLSKIVDWLSLSHS